MATKTVQVNKNDSYIIPPVKAGDNGNMLRVRLEAPSKIESIVYRCEGSSCGWVHECPDGGQCGGSYPSTYVKESDTVWYWYGWSNSGDNCVLIFTIQHGDHHQELLSEALISALVDEIRGDAAGAPPDLKDVFCKGWPGAKIAIDALLKIVKNPIAKLVLQIVETLGDAAQEAFCK